MRNSITSQSAANIAKFASNAVVIARIAFAVVDFTTGYEDTRTTLGIVKEPTIGQRILSGCLRLVKNLIPIVMHLYLLLLMHLLIRVNIFPLRKMDLPIRLMKRRI